MSQTLKYEIRCPKCGHAQSVDLYEAINVQQNPELKVALLANNLNAVTCPECKLTFRVDKPLLYNDPKHRAMIYLIPAGDASIAEGERQFTESLCRLHGALPEGVDAPRVSLVFNRAEMVERIFLFDAGLNERIIEYIKYMVYSKNSTKLNPARKALLFDAEDSTETALCFVVQDVATKKLEAVIQYDRDTYKTLNELFDQDEQTATLLELFPGPHISARALFLRDLQDSTQREIPERPKLERPE